MISCIFVFYIAILGPAFDARQAPDVPDRLYAQRVDVVKAREAEHLWTERLARAPRDFDTAWKLARARYWLGGHATEQERKTLYEQGIAAARNAVALQPNRPEGHFWIAANMGAL